MPVDVEKTKGIIDTLRKMSSKELAVTLFLVVGAVSGAFWIENRYAKIEETRSRIENTEIEIRKHKEEIIQMHIRTLELIRIQPKEVQEAIDKNSRAFMENYKRLEATK
jgi:sensor domain CHASE-containing protein